jgi:hypothetical protein
MNDVIADCQLPIADFGTFGANKLAIGNWQSAIGKTSWTQ